MCSSDYRAQARRALTGNWPTAVLVSLVAALLGASSDWSGLDLDFKLDADGLSFELSSELMVILSGVITAAAVVAAILIGLCRFIVGGAATLGQARYHLNLADGRDAKFEDLFSQFSRFGTALALNLLIALFVTLWSLLLVVPGIIAAYRYSMAFYIMLEDPNCSAMEAIDRSKRMMDGHKWDLFCLQLSFIGWRILAGFTFGIGNLFLTPYVNTSVAIFYRQLTTAPFRQLPGGENQAL